MKLIFWGTSHGVPQPDRFCSAALLQCADSFYLLDGGMLTLGPFCGLPACTKIPLGRGVCGTAAQKDEVQRIADVHVFPGHIACDSASRSEIVIPIHHQGRVIGVLDIDSPDLARFDELDERYLVQLATHIQTVCRFEHTAYSL